MEGETDAINFINERTARGGGARGVGSVDSGYSAGSDVAAVVRARSELGAGSRLGVCG
jgi:hypothetical protein